MFSRSPFMLSSLGPLGRAPITELGLTLYWLWSWRESSTALPRAATHLVQVNWKHPAFSKHGFHHKLELGLRREQIWEREQALTPSLGLWENWVSWGKWRRDGAVLARSSAAPRRRRVGIFLGFFFTTTFIKFYLNVSLVWDICGFSLNRFLAWLYFVPSLGNHNLIVSGLIKCQPGTWAFIIVKSGSIKLSLLYQNQNSISFFKWITLFLYIYLRWADVQVARFSNYCVIYVFYKRCEELTKDC